jgi:hypothetical protein
MARFFMFCPNCGQQTPNDGLRFCRQCGFRLDGVSQLLFSGGAPLPMQPAAAPLLPAAESPRRKGLKTGAKLMLTSAVIFPLVLAFAIGAVNSPFPLIFPFTLFLAGVARMVYARFFEDAQPSYAPVLMPPVASPASPVHATQPPPQPRSLFAHGPNTNDLSQQPSVTEKTTGLLKR